MKKIPLTRGLFALVDDEDYLNLVRFKWYAYTDRNGVSYARRNLNLGDRRVTVTMHRTILRAKPGEEVDHKSGDGLDNRRSNLRFCSHQENTQNKKRAIHNTSGFKGVSFYKLNKKWGAYITGEHLGLYDSAEEAAGVYDAEAKKRFGPFARLNFPETIQ